MKAYCITLDDNIRFLEQLTNTNSELLTDAPYFALLERLHAAYNTKFQLNMFYSYNENGFSLSDVPNKYKAQFEERASWLRLSFHSRYNEPAFPYENASPMRLIADFETVTNQLLRIAGSAAQIGTTTLHYMCATREAMLLLKAKGMRAFLGAFYENDDKTALRYYLSKKQADQIDFNGLWHDEKTDISFAKNSFILDKVKSEKLTERLNSIKGNSFVNILTHEQYFYPDYYNFQADYAAKLEKCVHFLTKNGYKSVLLEELC